jgi:hypothetical protein
LNKNILLLARYEVTNSPGLPGIKEFLMAQDFQC